LEIKEGPVQQESRPRERGASKTHTGEEKDLEGIVKKPILLRSWGRAKLGKKARSEEGVVKKK